MSSPECCIEAELFSVLKITGKLLVYSCSYSCNTDMSSLSDLEHPAKLQIPKGHKIDITYSSKLREEESSNSGSQKVTIAPKGSHCLTRVLPVLAQATDLLPQSKDSD